jgi:hypothetical protein
MRPLAPRYRVRGSYVVDPTVSFPKVYDCLLRDRRQVKGELSRPLYPLDRRLGGPQSRSGRGGEEKNSHFPPGIEP